MPQKDVCNGLVESHSSLLGHVIGARYIRSDDSGAVRLRRVHCNQLGFLVSGEAACAATLSVSKKNSSALVDIFGCSTASPQERKV